MTTGTAARRERIRASHDTYWDAEPAISTTVVLDDQLLDQATQLTGVRKRGVLLREALTALVERESARRLVRLGGAEPEIEAAPHRRPPA